MISDESFNILIKRMSEHRPVDAGLVIKLRPLLHEMRVRRGELIFPKGMVPVFAPFIISGSLREITIHPSTMQEETTWMWFEKDSVYTKPGFFSEEPAECAVEAMEDSQLVYIEHDDFIQLKKNIESVEKLSEMVRDYYHKLLKQHAFDLAVLTNQQRYDQFIAEHPRAMATLNHQHIASFLGIRDKGLDRYSSKK